ncbi:uncharacterized protein LOC135203133 isoform X2 [Macrobrachium nipponense]|uniref:uncharacterized protein LOC135203133 isoform X2 n=1 Tax=Macrobrachium nipponense TaxID=159736 RepID=UPI0030C8D181
MKSAPSYAQNTYATTQPRVPPSEMYGYPPPPKYNADSKVPVLGAAKTTAHELRKPSAQALSGHYGVPHQTGYSSQTISPKPSYHASSPAVKGIPHLAPHPARESGLKMLDRGLLVASRMLEEGEDLSVYIASVDSADSGYSEHSLTADDLMALTNFDVTKTLFRPPNILTGHPFFRPPRTLRRLIMTEDYLAS